MSTNGNQRGKANDDESVEIEGDGYKSLALKDIRDRIGQLCLRVPKDDELDPKDLDAVKAWASDLKAIIEEFNLLISCVAPATYKWGTDRSGAADQNLSVLSAELGHSQNEIQATVSSHLSNVLAPVVDLVVEKVVMTKQKDGSEVKENFYCCKQVDPDLVHVCSNMLCRNATLLRQVCLANFHKIHRCIGDFLEAQVKDNQHDSRGFAF